MKQIIIPLLLIAIANVPGAYSKCDFDVVNSMIPIKTERDLK
jgi:hypothetical protein